LMCVPSVSPWFKLAVDFRREVEVSDAFLTITAYCLHFVSTAITALAMR